MSDLIRAIKPYIYRDYSTINTIVVIQLVMRDSIIWCNFKIDFVCSSPKFHNTKCHMKKCNEIAMISTF